MRSSFFVFLTSATLALPAVASEVSRTLPASQDAHVEISNVAGDITISGWERAEVSVEGRLGPGVEELRFEGDSRRLVVKVIPSRRRGGEAFLTIRVPFAASLGVSTVSAPIAVSAATGALEAASVSGSLRIGDGLASVRAETVSGSTDIGACRGIVKASSVSGRIAIRDARSGLEATTVSGSLDVRGQELEAVELEAVSGSIRFAGGLAPRGRLVASSHSGDVVLELPTETNADITASSFSGSISNAFGKPATRNSHGPGTELSFRLGAGGARISAQAFSGDVTLRALR